MPAEIQIAKYIFWKIGMPGVAKGPILFLSIAIIGDDPLAFTWALFNRVLNEAHEGNFQLAGTVSDGDDCLERFSAKILIRLNLRIRAKKQ